MKHKLTTLALVLALLAALIPSAAMAAKATEEITIDVRNHTGAPVELNYRGDDGVTRWTTVPTGVSSLTLPEGSYAYWADPKCGHIAGNVKLVNNKLTLWIICQDIQPALFTSHVTAASPYSCSDWGVYFPGIAHFYTETYWTGTDFATDVLSWSGYYGGVYTCIDDLVVSFYFDSRP